MYHFLPHLLQYFNLEEEKEKLIQSKKTKSTVFYNQKMIFQYPIDGKLLTLKQQSMKSKTSQNSGGQNS